MRFKSNLFLFIAGTMAFWGSKESFALNAFTSQSATAVGLQANSVREKIDVSNLTVATKDNKAELLKKLSKIINVLPGQYLPAGESKTKTCPEKKYCKGGNFSVSNVDQGIEDCPAVSVGASTVMTKFPEKWYPNEGKIETLAVQVQPWTSGIKTIEECRAIYTIKNNRGVLRDEGVFYNSNTGKYDSVRENGWFYTQINPGYYGKEQYYSKDHPCFKKSKENINWLGLAFDIYMIYRNAEKCDAGDNCPGFVSTNKTATAMPRCDDPNYDYNSPVIGAPANVKPGNYLPANSTDSKPCPTNDNVYCPGGKYSRASVDQGKFKCPFNGRQNGNKTGCLVTVSAQTMQFGSKGPDEKRFSRQCWFQDSDEDYTDCVFGIRAKK